jgi:hypothetical protein
MSDPLPVHAAPCPPDLPDAFPRALRADALALRATDVWHPHRCHLHFIVAFADETLAIPTRLYFDASLLETNSGRDARQRAMLWCLGTRHHDGHVREDCLRHLLANLHDWMAPFIVHLVGEYVHEIIELIDTALATLDPRMEAAFARFARDNPRYIDTIERRTISYRPAGYDRRSGRLPDYPGARAVARLRQLALTGHDTA